MSTLSYLAYPGGDDQEWPDDVRASYRLSGHYVVCGLGLNPAHHVPASDHRLRIARESTGPGGTVHGRGDVHGPANCVDGGDFVHNFR